MGGLEATSGLEGLGFGSGAASAGSAGTTAAGGAGASSSGLGLLGLAPYAGVAGGLALGAKGVSDLLKDKETKGLAGWGGRATLGIATGGLSELARGLGLFSGPKTKVEDERLQSLKDKGLLSKDFQIKDESRSREQQLQDALKSGEQVNEDWLRTGDEKYLRPQDIQGYAALLEKDARINDAGLDERLKLAEKALAAGAVDEHKGTIDIDWNKVAEWEKKNPNFTAKGLMGLSQPTPAPAAVAPQQAAVTKPSTAQQYKGLFG